MEAHFQFLLGQPLNLTVTVVGDHQVFNQIARSASAPTRTLQWNAHAREAEWTGYPAEYYTGFRDYARALPGVPPAQRRDILAVQRMDLQGYEGPPTGCARRCLDERFYDALLEDSQEHGYDTAVLSFEGSSVADQIAMFSDVKVVLSQHGAALSNILFARPGTLVVEIGSRDFPCYTRLAEKLGLPYLHYESTEYSEEVAQGLSGNASAQVSRVMDVRDVIRRFVLADTSTKAAPVRCPNFATCVGQQFA
jgi:hypothetical protein